jgi:V/A-type H+-transporting ATPase subunit K
MRRRASVRKASVRRASVRKALVMVVLLMFAGVGTGLWAEEASSPSTTAAQEPKKRDLPVGLIALAAALALGLCALGTGLAQSRIGAAGAGTIAEKPEAMGTIILLLAIPETMVILGFVVAVIILFTL